MLKVLIAVPAWNEQESIAKVLEEITALFPDFHTIVIDDGSDDLTGKVATEHGVTVVRHNEHQGYVAAIHTGRVYTLEHSYNYLIFIDADGQHRISDIGRILDPLMRGDADQVRGSRELGQYEIAEPLYLKIPRLFCSALVSLRNRKIVTDATSGFIGENRNMAELFKTQYQTSDKLHSSNTMHIEEHLIAHNKGFTITEVPTLMRNRNNGKTKCNTWKQLLRFPVDLVRTFARNLY